MEDNNQIKPTTSQRFYKWLDRFLLFLITAELGYFTLLILGGIVVAILSYTIDFSLDFSRYHTSFLWPVLPFILALPLNMLGGFAGIVLNLLTKHQGYPGTGHFLNWLFLATTGWLFILALVFLLPPIMSTYG
jgi:hypothetical protein